MNRIYQLSAAVLYVILFFLLFSFYQYIIDVDAISYIHVAERLAAGKYYEGLNGYWSPLISWILIPFIKMGFEPAMSAKYINGLLGLLLLFSSNKLTDKFNINDFIKKILPFIFTVICLSYCFFEIGADLLQLLIIISYINLLLSKDFIHNNLKIIIAGVIGAFAYFAKAYNLPFFIIHITLAFFIILKKDKKENIFPALIKKTGIALIAFVIIISPYIIAISHKYGSFTFSTAGKLNMSWFISPGLSNDNKIIAPPHAIDATSSWDDPFYAQEKIVTPFSSIQSFVQEIRWSISNFFKLTDLLHGISIFSILIFSAFLFFLLYRKKETNASEWLLFLTPLIYAGGYLLVFIEWRYIWLLPILLLLIGAVLLSWLLNQKYLTPKAFVIIALLLTVSFLQQPVTELKNLRWKNKQLFEEAAIFNKNNIHGNWFLHYKHGEQYAETVVLAYLTKSRLYGPVGPDYTADELLKKAQEHNIDYYLFYYTYPNEKELFLSSPYIKASVKVYPDLYPGLILLQLK